MADNPILQRLFTTATRCPLCGARLTVVITPGPPEKYCPKGHGHLTVSEDIGPYVRFEVNESLYQDVE